MSISYPIRRAAFLHLPRCGLCRPNILGIDQHGRADGLGDQFMQQSERFCTTSFAKKFTPVALPLGRARLATKKAPRVAPVFNNWTGFYVGGNDGGHGPDITLTKPFGWSIARQKFNTYFFRAG
jgi:hypothetical protein